MSAPRMRELAALVRALPELGRARLSVSVGVTAACGALLAGSARDAATALVAVGLLAAGASALNQVQEREADRGLSRTRWRPIPAGTVSAPQAGLVAVFLLAAGFAALAAGGGAAAPLRLAFAALVLYNGIYTPLKRVTAAAILPGAVAGAIPPLIGAAVAGAIPPSAVVLAGAIMVWQVPHTWLIELQHRADYLAVPRPTFSRLFSRPRLERLVFTWNVAFAILPPVVVLAAGGNAASPALGGACCLSVILAGASVPLLTPRLPRLSHRQLSALLRAGLLAAAGLAAVATR